MTPAIDWPAIQALIAARLKLDLRPAGTVSGGCIHTAWRLDGADSSFFLKLNRREHAELFAAEADGLEALAASGTVRVPRPLLTATTEKNAFLLLEWLDLTHPDSARQAVLGEQVARLHGHLGDAFGWRRDNFIGSTPQPNGQLPDWVAFLRARRLGFQFQLAAAGGHGSALREKGERLLAVLEVFFADYSPSPSLLHGDLWAGNHAVAGGRPVLFDPAVYYGDRESDLAMSELFGGFSREFYAAYCSCRPLDSGYKERRDLYQLYHLLNHLNLFGGGYRAQALAVTERLLAASGA